MLDKIRHSYIRQLAGNAFERLVFAWQQASESSLNSQIFWMYVAVGDSSWLVLQSRHVASSLQWVIRAFQLEFRKKAYMCINREQYLHVDIYNNGYITYSIYKSRRVYEAV